MCVFLCFFSRLMSVEDWTRGPSVPASTDFAVFTCIFATAKSFFKRLIVYIQSVFCNFIGGSL